MSSLETYEQRTSMSGGKLEYRTSRGTQYGCAAEEIRKDDLSI